MGDLASAFDLRTNALGHLTSGVQLGFIAGTLIFAFLSIADRISPSKVFFYCALAGSIFNLGLMLPTNGLSTLMLFRFSTGFFLAGIYPVGMKIAADYFNKGLGLSLGFLVGALVLGTSFPHFLKGFAFNTSWQIVIMATSGMAILGGVLIRMLVPDGPHRKAGKQFDPNAMLLVFKNPSFRAASFGYFGHMWELYTFWTFVPLILSTYIGLHPGTQWNVSIISFIIIGIGGPGCVLGGYISRTMGEKKTATLALILSGLCCLLALIMFRTTYSSLFLVFLIIWGVVVIADSPLFSTLVAKSAPSEIKGTALTIVNCIGFSLTIFSIQWTTFLLDHINIKDALALLAIGPGFGVLSLLTHRKKYEHD